jgi:hypothetical protein
MHPFLTPELACIHERDLRREVAAARGPARKRRRYKVTATPAAGTPHTTTFKIVGR